MYYFIPLKQLSSPKVQPKRGLEKKERIKAVNLHPDDRLNRRQ
jgi:hypothetical protein